jgi:NTP pyrophosphatase (non-canonical NTP hydrolase)
VAKKITDDNAYFELIENNPKIGGSDSYDSFVQRLAKYPKQQFDADVVSAMYCALGLVGEAGEASEKIKKWHRDGVIDRASVGRELGDVLYYLTSLANLFGYSLKDIENMNREKLTDRVKRNKIHGTGDNR